MGAVNSTEAAAAVAQQNILTTTSLSPDGSGEQRSAAECPIPHVARQMQGKSLGSIADCPVLGSEQAPAGSDNFISECPMTEEERQAYVTDKVDPLNMVR